MNQRKAYTCIIPFQSLPPDFLNRYKKRGTEGNDKNGFNSEPQS